MVQTDNESGLRLGYRKGDPLLVGLGALIVVREQRLNDNLEDPIRGSIAKLDVQAGVKGHGRRKRVERSSLAELVHET